MRDEEFPACLDYFIPGYAAEISANYGLSPSESLAQAQQEVADGLPGGVNAHGQVLLCLTQSCGHMQQLVGYLWYKPDAKMRSVLIADFHILTSCQGKG